MTPEREAYFREQAEACENADPTEIRELCDAIAAGREEVERLRDKLGEEQDDYDTLDMERDDILRKKRVGLGKTKKVIAGLRADVAQLKKALLFYTAGMGCYDDWTVEQLLEEMDSHE